MSCIKQRVSRENGLYERLVSSMGFSLRAGVIFVKGRDYSG